MHAKVKFPVANVSVRLCGGCPPAQTRWAPCQCHKAESLSGNRRLKCPSQGSPSTSQRVSGWRCLGKQHSCQAGMEQRFTGGAHSPGTSGILQLLSTISWFLVRCTLHVALALNFCHQLQCLVFNNGHWFTKKDTISEERKKIVAARPLPFLTLRVHRIWTI